MPTKKKPAVAEPKRRGRQPLPKGEVLAVRLAPATVNLLKARKQTSSAKERAFPIDGCPEPRPGLRLDEIPQIPASERYPDWTIVITDTDLHEGFDSRSILDLNAAIIIEGKKVYLKLRHHYTNLVKSIGGNGSKLGIAGEIAYVARDFKNPNFEGMERYSLESKRRYYLADIVDPCFYPTFLTTKYLNFRIIQSLMITISQSNEICKDEGRWHTSDIIGLLLVAATVVPSAWGRAENFMPRIICTLADAALTDPLATPDQIKQICAILREGGMATGTDNEIIGGTCIKVIANEENYHFTVAENALNLLRKINDSN